MNPDSGEGAKQRKVGGGRRRTRKLSLSDLERQGRMEAVADIEVWLGPEDEEPSILVKVVEEMSVKAIAETFLFAASALSGWLTGYVVYYFSS